MDIIPNNIIVSQPFDYRPQHSISPQIITALLGQFQMRICRESVEAPIRAWLTPLHTSEIKQRNPPLVNTSRARV